jgi:hypothetical protein
LDRGEPTAVKEFRDLTRTLSEATNADLALAGVSADGRWEAGDGDQMSLRDTISVVNDLRNDLMLDEPVIEQIVRNQPISRAEQRMAQIRAKQLETDDRYKAARLKNELWARQTSRLMAYLLTAPVIEEN